MAAPTYQAVGAFGETTANTVAFTYPALAANDLLFLLVYDNGYGGTLTINSSWTIVKLLRNYGGVRLFRKIATGSETGTENITRGTYTEGTTFAAQCFSFRGDAFISVENFSSGTGISDTITWPSVSVGGTERTMAAFIVNRYGGNPGLPTGYTLQSDDQLVNDSTYFELSTKTNVSTGPAVTATGGSIDGWSAIHVAIYNNTPPVLTPYTFIVN